MAGQKHTQKPNNKVKTEGKKKKKGKGGRDHLIKGAPTVSLQLQHRPSAPVRLRKKEIVSD